MKKLAVLFIMLAWVGLGKAQAVYVEGTADYVGSPNTSGQAFGFKLGTERNGYDYSFGYKRSELDLSSERLNSNGVDIHTLSLNLAKIGHYGRFKTTVGGGLGWAVTELSAEEKADNDVSFLFGAGTEYILGHSWSIGGSLGGQFLKTNVMKTVRSSHFEALSTGQSVEIEDVIVSQETVNLSNFQIGLRLKYAF